MSFYKTLARQVGRVKLKIISMLVNLASRLEVVELHKLRIVVYMRKYGFLIFGAPWANEND